MNRLAIESKRVSSFESNKILQLPYTLYDMNNSLGFTSGFRPYRQDGIRLQRQNMDGKIIYHNYGHGGGGLSVAYGCALQLIQRQFFPLNIPISEEIAVLGAGIVGLTTAYLLCLKGYKVNVYAELYPFQLQKGKPQITSTVAGGYWMPLKLGQKQKTKKVAIETWKHYEQVILEQIKTGANLGITKVPTYCINDDQGLTYFQIEGVIHPKEINVTFGDGVVRKAITFPSLVIESRKYLPYLIETMKKTGRVTFYKEKLTKQSTFSKPQIQLFNCCGLGAPILFGDSSLNKGIKGHVIFFDLNKQSQVKDFILFMKTPKGRWILQIPHIQSGKLVLGISYEQGKTDEFPEQQQVKSIYETAKNFFDDVAKRNKK